MMNQTSIIGLYIGMAFGGLVALFLVQRFGPWQALEMVRRATPYILAIAVASAFIRFLFMAFYR